VEYGFGRVLGLQGHGSDNGQRGTEQGLDQTEGSVHGLAGFLANNKSRLLYVQSGQRIAGPESLAARNRYF
jgi:hypothetical protein